MKRPPITGHEFDCLIIIEQLPGISPPDFAFALWGDMPLETAWLRGMQQLEKLRLAKWIDAKNLLTRKGEEAISDFIIWALHSPYKADTHEQPNT